MCWARAKQNTTVKTTIDACSMLAKLKFSDLVGKHVSSLIINFKQVIKPFLVWNTYFTFFLSVVDNTFYKSNIKSDRLYIIIMSRTRKKQSSGGVL